MSEFRQDRITGDCVIIAPERGRRPQNSPAPPAGGKALPRFDPHCPFCAGNEALLPGITAEQPAANPPGWQVRVVPNKFPAVSLTASDIAGAATSHFRSGVGIHEVIIESPRHNAELASMPAHEVAAAIGMYRRRFSALLDRVDILTIVLFRNYGATSGASLMHPHAQLIGLGMVPPWLEAKERWAREQGAGTCATCDELNRERRDRSRLIEETEYFVASVPFAATVPFEIMIVPNRHYGSFADISDTEIEDFAAVLRRALQRLKSIHGDPPYNLFVTPVSTAELRRPHSHWQLRIVPNLAKWGGFERATGMPINPSCPEDDAALLHTAPADLERMA